MSVRLRTDWIQTFTGRQFWPMEPRVEDINIVDIAHALSNSCRFNGHCSQFYSVAQHSVLVSTICDPADALWGLLHDAAEAYLVDLPRPVKHSGHFEQFRVFERSLEAAICKRFGLSPEQPESVSKADRALLRTEQRDLMGPAPEEWQDNREGAIETIKIEPWPPAFAKLKFVHRFAELTGDRRVANHV